MIEDRIHWIHQDDAEILIADLSGLKNKELIDTIKEVWDYIEHCGKDEVNGLFNLSESYIDMNHLWDLEQNTDIFFTNKIHKIALIGNGELHDVLAPNIQAFGTVDLDGFYFMDDALSWLMAG